MTQGEVQFTFAPTGTAGAADDFSLDDVQLEAASAASTFERPTIAAQIEECQRHYCKTFPYNTAPAQNGGVAGALGMATASTTSGSQGVQWQYPVTMRATPTIVTYNPSAANANWRRISASSDATVQVDPETTISASGVFITEQTTALVVGARYYIHATADAGI